MSLFSQFLSRQSELRLPVRNRIETIMPDAHKAALQDMHEETADEFFVFQRQFLLRIMVSVISVAEP